MIKLCPVFESDAVIILIDPLQAFCNLVDQFLIGRILARADMRCSGSDIEVPGLTCVIDQSHCKIAEIVHQTEDLAVPVAHIVISDIPADISGLFCRHLADRLVELHVILLGLLA